MQYKRDRWARVAGLVLEGLAYLAAHQARRVAARPPAPAGRQVTGRLADGRPDPLAAPMPDLDPSAPTVPITGPIVDAE